VSGITASPSDIAFPLALVVNQTNVGGESGLTCTVRVRLGADATRYLDFADNTFKSSGWTTQNQPLTDIGAGHYSAPLDLSALGLLAGVTLVLEFQARRGGLLIGDSSDVVSLVQASASLPQPRISVSAIADNASSATMKFLAHLMLDGIQNTGAVSALISFKDPSGAELVPAAAMFGPTADGVFTLEVPSVTLLSTTNYYCDVTIVDSLSVPRRQLGITPTIG